MEIFEQLPTREALPVTMPDYHRPPPIETYVRLVVALDEWEPEP